jgi:hypothetical protein
LLDKIMALFAFMVPDRNRFMFEAQVCGDERCPAGDHVFIINNAE